MSLWLLLLVVAPVYFVLRRHPSGAPPQSNKPGPSDGPGRPTARRLGSGPDAACRALGLGLALTGVDHFWAAADYVAMLDPEMSGRWPLVLGSATLRLVLGVLLWPRGTRVAAAWGALVLFIAVFPVNARVAMTGVLGSGVPVAAWLAWSRVALHLGWLAWIVASLLALKPGRTPPGDAATGQA